MHVIGTREEHAHEERFGKEHHNSGYSLALVRSPCTMTAAGVLDPGVGREGKEALKVMMRWQWEIVHQTSVMFWMLFSFAEMRTIRNSHIWRRLRPSH